MPNCILMILFLVPPAVFGYVLFMILSLVLIDCLLVLLIVSFLASLEFKRDISVIVLPHIAFICLFILSSCIFCWIKFYFPSIFLSCSHSSMSPLDSFNPHSLMTYHCHPLLPRVPIKEHLVESTSDSSPSPVSSSTMKLFESIDNQLIALCEGICSTNKLHAM